MLKAALLIGLVWLVTACGHHVYHRVREGETLYAIGWRYGQDYRKIAQWNDIAPPYVIYNGQLLRVAPPNEPWWAEREQERRAAEQVFAKAEPQSRPRPAPVLKPEALEPGSRAAEIGDWRWPTKGKVVKGFSAPLSKGVDIAGEYGQSVVAASSGKVVYSGSGLIGYGKLVIIKHNKVYLSAYAYNDQLLVAEGDEVKAGQEIAKMGRASNQEPRLHFEIRRNGQPVDPMAFLK